MMKKRFSKILTLSCEQPYVGDGAISYAHILARGREGRKEKERQRASEREGRERER